MLTHLLVVQNSGAFTETPKLGPGETGGVPNLPVSQSVSLSNVCIPNIEGGPVGQVFLQPTAIVPQISQSVAQQHFQVKKVYIFYKYKQLLQRDKALNSIANLSKEMFI